MTSWSATLAAVCGLALVHVFAGRLTFLEGVPRNRWLSFAGGISVAYVVVRILPELSASEHKVEGPATAAAPFLEKHVYLLVLLGLIVFYGVERLSARSRQRRREETGVDETEDLAFALSIGAFALYNAVIGYVIADFAAAPEESLPIFALALAVHFLVNDFGLREHHKRAYRRSGRWLLAAGVLAGWVVGRSASLDESALGILIALLAGGILLNTFKEELPSERESRFLPFLIGAVGYATLLQLA